MRVTQTTRGALVAAAAAALVAAAPAGAADYAAALAQARVDGGAEIAAGAVLSHGRVVWTGADGGNTPATAVFSLASLTKTYTATLVLQLVQRGKIGLGDHIGRWLAGRIPAAAARVTVRQLLRHTSGLPDYLDDPHVAAALNDPRHHWTEAELLRAVRAPNGRGKFAYSNTNYLLLGAILRRVTHEGEGRLLARRILAPLHLTGTSMTRTSAFAAGVAGGGRLGNDVWGPIWGDGGIVATAADVGRFLDGLLVGGRLLSAKTVRTMLDPGPDGTYGMGIYSGKLLGHTVYGHDGSYGGWQSLGFTDRSNGTTLVVLLRGEKFGVYSAMNDIAAAAKEDGLL